MTSQLTRIPLAELCTAITSGGTPSRKEPGFWNGGTIPWIKTGELSDWKVTRIGEYITPLGLEKSAAKIFPSGTILMAMYGDGRTITTLGLVDEPSATNQACCAFLVDPDKCDNLYLFYALKHHRHELLKLVVAGAQRNLSTGIIKRFPVPVRPIEEQRRIAVTLSAYDDLIENNRRRIALLEDAARQLYKEWFVRFRFPGHEHVEMIDGVPEGWAFKTIEEVCETIGGGTPSTKKPEYWDDGDVLWFTPTDVTRNSCLALLTSETKISESGLNNSSAKMIPAGAILMTSRASVGFFGINRLAASTNQGFISIVPHDSAFRMYILQNLMWRVEEIRSHAGGATYKEISKGRFRALPILVPPAALAGEYEQQASLIHAQVETLHISNQQLAKARDLLLPKLMNGTLTV